MFGYINKDKLMKTLNEEVRLQEQLGDTYRKLAHTHMEMKLSAKTEGDRQWCDCEWLKYTRWAEEADWKLVEAQTIYNMVKQM